MLRLSFLVWCFVLLVFIWAEEEECNVFQVLCVKVENVYIFSRPLKKYEVSSFRSSYPHHHVLMTFKLSSLLMVIIIEVRKEAAQESGPPPPH